MAFTDKIGKTYVYLAIAFLLIFLVFLQYNPFNFSTDSIAKKPFAVNYLESMCMDKANAGSLYKYSETSCHNGPLYDALIGKIKAIFPDSFGFMIFLISSLLYISIFVFLYKILKREVGGFFFFSLFLYILLVPAYNMFRFDLSDLLAFFWFFAGFYLLFYTYSKQKDFIAGLLFANSFLTKQTYIFPIFLVFLLYFVLDAKIIAFENKKLAFNKNNAYKLLLFLAPLVLLIILSNIAFPLFLTYTFYLGALPDLSPADVVPAMLNILKLESMTLLLLMSMFLTSMYFIFKKRSIISLFTFFSLITAFYLFMLDSSVYEYKRLIFIVPFFIILCCTMAKDFRPHITSMYVLAFVVLILMFPLLKVMYLNFQMSSLEQEVGYVWSLFPEQSLILADKDRLRLYADKESIITLIPRGRFYGEEAFVSKISEDLNLMDRQQWEVNEYDKIIEFFQDYIKDISNKSYSSVALLPMGEGYDLATLILFMKHISKENNLSFQKIFPFSCKVFIPSIEDRCRACGYKVEVYFLEMDDCTSMKNAVEDYYKERLGNICMRDKVTWGFITNATIYNDGNVTETCGLDGGNLMERYENKFYLNKTDFVMLLALAIIMAFYFRKK